MKITGTAIGGDNRLRQLEDWSRRQCRECTGLGFVVGVVLVCIIWGAVSGYHIYRSRADYMSPTGLMVLQLRNQDGTIAEFYNHTGTPLDDLRAPLGVNPDQVILTHRCIDFAAKADKRAVRLERGIYPAAGKDGAK